MVLIFFFTLGQLNYPVFCAYMYPMSYLQWAPNQLCIECVHMILVLLILFVNKQQQWVAFPMSQAFFSMNPDNQFMFSKFHF